MPARISQMTSGMFVRWKMISPSAQIRKIAAI
jgi:hypothetical protein